jgi:hypothetical protein
MSSTTIGTDIPLNSLIDSKVSVSETEVIPQTEFIIGSTSTSPLHTNLPFQHVDNNNIEASAIQDTIVTTTTNECDAYVECVRLLTRQLRQSSIAEGKKEGDDKETDCLSLHDIDWQERYVKASCGVSELLSLQNAIIQMQHAFHLIRQEANMSMDDTSVAIHNAQHWKREYNTMKQVVTSLQHENNVLKQQNDILFAEKRKLKTSYKKLLAQQHVTQTQQVESYVISALLSHEQLLNCCSNNSTTSYTGKNRSRTTTLDTTGTTTGDDFTTLDDPFTNSPTSIEFSNNSTPKAMSENDKGHDHPIEASTIISRQLPPTVVTMKEQQYHPSQQKGMNGFGNACHAIGMKFKFMDHHKKQQHQRHPTAESKEESKVNVNDGNAVNITTEIKNDETISPIPTSRPYVPIRFDVITPTRSEDSNDSQSIKKRVNIFQSPSEDHSANNNLKPLIDVTTLMDESIEYTNESNSNMIDTNYRSADPFLLSLPILQSQQEHGQRNVKIKNDHTNTMMKSESPISIPEVDDGIEEEEMLVCSSLDPSMVQVQCQRYNCDPYLIRSLSIPTIPIHVAQQKQQHKVNCEETPTLSHGIKS